jgi:tetratricopeptide (TPR) repeat protein
MKRSLLFTLFALLVLFLIGCPSTPTVKVDLPKQEYDSAKNLKTKITKHGFDAYAPDDYSAAQAKFTEGETAYDKDNAVAKTALDEAIVGYKKVVRAGIIAKMKDRQTDIDGSVQMADDIKANVATPDEYNKAKAAYDKAIAAANEDDWDTAVTSFDEAKTLYEDAYNKSKEKKDKAAEAMDESKKSIEDIETKAQELDADGSDENVNP